MVLSVATYPGATAFTLTPAEAHLLAKRMSQLCHCALCCGIAGDKDASLERQDHGNIDHLAVAAIRHFRTERATELKYGTEINRYDRVQSSVLWATASSDQIVLALFASPMQWPATVTSAIVPPKVDRGAG